MSYSEDYRAGWAAARLQYQSTGGVMPHPPEPVEEPEPEPAKAPPGPLRKGPPRKTKVGD